MNFFNVKIALVCWKQSAEVFTHKYGDIEHPRCIHRGDNCCHYIVTWDKFHHLHGKEPDITYLL